MPESFYQCKQYIPIEAHSFPANLTKKTGFIHFLLLCVGGPSRLLFDTISYVDPVDRQWRRGNSPCSPYCTVSVINTLRIQEGIPENWHRSLMFRNHVDKVIPEEILESCHIFLVFRNHVDESYPREKTWELSHISNIQKSCYVDKVIPE